MRHYLGLAKGQNLMATEESTVKEWMNLLGVEPIPGPEISGIYTVIAMNGESFSADTYNELMEKVDETILRFNRG